MLYWAAIFVIAAVVTGALSFGGYVSPDIDFVTNGVPTPLTAIVDGVFFISAAIAAALLVFKAIARAYQPRVKEIIGGPLPPKEPRKPR